MKDLHILALDLGTKTGWACFYSRNPDCVVSGSKLLATEKELREQRKQKRDRCCDIRVPRLYDFIKSFKDITHIYFEDVQFLSSQAQSQLWASLRAMVTLESQLRIVRAVPVGTLKKFATGMGNAKKEHMAQALAHPVGDVPKFDVGYSVIKENGETVLYKHYLASSLLVDDNEADALHLLNYAIKELNGSRAKN